MKRFRRLILADLKQQRRFTALFVLNLTLGLVGFIALDSFRHNLQSALQARSRNVLGADLGISARHPISAEQAAAARKEIGEDAARSEIVELYSMAASRSGDSRLVQIKSVDRAFPFYGHIQLKNQGEMRPPKSFDIHDGRNVWVYPELLVQLGVDIGDEIKIGAASFKIADVVEDDAASGFSTSMAPRIYLGLNQLSATELIQTGSLAWYRILFQKNGLDDFELENLVSRIFSSPDLPSSVRVFSHKNESEQMSRMLKYLTDYLGLVSIAAIFLASLGAAFLFRTFLNRKIREIAILRSLGMTLRDIVRILIFQVLILGAAASLLAFAVSQALNPMIHMLLQKLAAVPIPSDWRWQSLAVAFGLSLVGSLLISLPLLVQMRGVKPALLFLQAGSVRLRHNRWSTGLYILSAAALWLLSVWQAHSWKIGSAFIASFLISAAVLGIAVYLLFRLFDRRARSLPLAAKLAVRHLSRQPKTMIPCFLALGLGVMLLNVIPQIQASLQTELERPDQSKLPSFFLFDIQEDQIEDLKTVASGFCVDLQQLSPMIQSRLVRINGKAFEKVNANERVFSREEEQSARSRNRGYNLSYREALSESEEIVEGRDFTGRFDPARDTVAEVSVERRFADRMGIKLGDELTFDVQSVEVTGRVVNLRSVRWTSFQPNFFLQFQEGVLEEAPKTLLATVADLPLETKIRLQNAVVKKLPNISMVDVTRIVKGLTEVSSQMSLALQFMAALCLVVGFMVLYSIATHQAQQRQRDINLVKVLGAPYALIRATFILEFVVLAFLAGVLGAALSVAISYILSKILFESIWAWSPWVPLGSLALLVVLSAVLAALSLRRVLAAKASFYLKPLA